MNKLTKTCPFCGGEVEIFGGPEAWTPTFRDPDSGGEPYYIHCRKCNLTMNSTSGDEYSDLIKRWNRRVNNNEKI